MSENSASSEAAASVEVRVEFEGECPSLTARSSIAYQIGRDPAGLPLFRLLHNSGKGMFCKDWAPVARIDALLSKAPLVSARTFNAVHPGKSINTGGFILAVLKDLGIVRVREGSRHHERVPGATLQQAVVSKTSPSASEGTRKAKSS